jgi:hypothetical protein
MTARASTRRSSDAWESQYAAQLPQSRPVPVRGDSGSSRGEHMAGSRSSTLMVCLPVADRLRSVTDFVACSIVSAAGTTTTTSTRTGSTTRRRCPLAARRARRARSPPPTAISALLGLHLSSHPSRSRSGHPAHARCGGTRTSSPRRRSLLLVARAGSAVAGAFLQLCLRSCLTSSTATSYGRTVARTGRRSRLRSIPRTSLTTLTLVRGG